MKVRIINVSTNSKWYKGLEGEIFDVTRRPSGGYRLMSTEANERVIQIEHGHLMSRLHAPDSGIGLGISKEDAEKITPETNKGAASLLSKEW